VRLPIIDVILLPPPTNAAWTDEEKAVVMHALRRRLATLSRVVTSVVVVETDYKFRAAHKAGARRELGLTNSSKRKGPPPGCIEDSFYNCLVAAPRLSVASEEWLHSSEVEAHNVTIIAMPEATGRNRTYRIVKFKQWIRYTRLKLVQDQMSRLIDWLERHRPSQYAHMAPVSFDPDEQELSGWSRNLVQLAAPSRAATSSSLGSGRRPLAYSRGCVVLTASCSITKQRGYGSRVANDRLFVETWRNSTFLFSTHYTWQAWRGRRSIIVMAEPPGSNVNWQVNSRKSFTPPDHNWPHACHWSCRRGRNRSAA